MDMDHHGMHGMNHDHASMTGMGSMGDDASSHGHLLCQSDMGMIMYMEGFQWTLKGEGSCLNFFFESWKLDTIPKFLAAMVCALAMGVATEGINRWKHNVAQQSKRTDNGFRVGTDGRKLRLMHSCLQGLSILSAYLLMLVVMTYSLELLFCVILGLMIGYYVFDGDSLHHGGGTPCCNFLEGSDGTEAGSALTEALLTTTTSTGGDLDETTRIDAPASYSCCNEEGVGSQNEEAAI